MATTLEIIDATVQRLKAKLPGLAVDYYPERPADFRLNHPQGALLVSYPGSGFGATVDTGYVAQERRIKFTVTVVCRQLNGSAGAVATLDLVRAALLGWRAPDCGKATAESEKFLGQSTGTWQYALGFEAESMAVEDADVDTDAPLNQVTTEEEQA